MTKRKGPPRPGKQAQQAPKKSPPPIEALAIASQGVGGEAESQAPHRQAVKWAKASAWANRWMVGVSVAGLIMVVCQLRSAAQSDELAALSIEVSNRPWVWVRSAIMPTFSPAETIVQLTVTNTGKSPALHLFLREPPGPERDSPWTSTVEGIPPGSILGPGQDSTFTLVYRNRISEELFNEIKRGARGFKILREIVYRDQFSEDERVHPKGDSSKGERVYPVCFYYEPRLDALATCIGAEDKAPGKVH